MVRDTALILYFSFPSPRLAFGRATKLLRPAFFVLHFFLCDKRFPMYVLEFVKNPKFCFSRFFATLEFRLTNAN